MASTALTKLLPLYVLFRLAAPDPVNLPQNFHTTFLTVTQLLPQGKFAQLPADYIPHTSIGKAYKIHNENVPWYVAKQRCYNESAQLALIDSQSKLDYVKSQRTVWIDLHVGIQKINDTWISAATGQPVSSETPWATDHPLNNTHECGLIYWTMNKVINVSCEWERYYVCEIQIPSWEDE